MRGLTLLAILLPAMAFAKKTKPNVIVIYIDDMGYADLSSYGGKMAQTPNMDRIGKEGIKFNQYYSAAPVSSASRVGVTTGQFPMRLGINTFLANKEMNKLCQQQDYLNPQAPSMARAFKNAGYATAHFGKWHMGGGRDVKDAPMFSEYGFDEYTSTHESPDADPKISPSWGIWSADDEIERWDRTRYFVDKTLDFVSRHSDDTPFFINLWPDDVHTPWVPNQLTLTT
ncbi:MAG: sulfatase-like hydrolase/transferase [Rikenellaceae bacterium]